MEDRKVESKKADVRIVPYNPEWPKMFENEAERIQIILGEELLEVHHIGSTAIPGMIAKPLIDILPIVRNIDKVDEFNKVFIQEGYEPWGEFGLPGRRYFDKMMDGRSTVHIHIYEKDNPEVIRHLAFRDFLIAHPGVAKEYGALKKKLVAKYSGDRDSYIDGKDGFVKRVECQAVDWWLSR